MLTIGYLRSFSKRYGGLRRLALVDAAGVVSARFVRRTASFSAITLNDGYEFRSFELPEDQGLLSETATLRDGVFTVEHRLTIAVEGLGVQESMAISALAARCEGIVALLETNSGERLLAGYSPELGTESALRLAEVNGASGAAPLDTPIRTLTLAVSDGALFRPFTGDVPSWIL
ncbi:MAG: hypothetical protein LBH06_09365 [Rikenellaceae bacterium]|jgi:hypothetical protein|nr:hypothetical protein [Rikenellaceae bacterium]